MAAFANLTAEHTCKPEHLPPEEYGVLELPVVGSVAIYKGSIVVWQYTGGALTGYVTYGSNTASELFAGVAASAVTSSSSAGDIIKVYRKGIFEFLKDTAAVTDRSVEFYVEGGTDGSPAEVQSGTSTGPKVGVCVGVVGTTRVKLQIDNYVK